MPNPSNRSVALFLARYLHAKIREEFERSKQGEPMRTGGKFQQSSSEGEEAWDVVVPYCTVGYRSGQYAKKLMDLGCV